MFTGIIEETGVIRRIKRGPASAVIQISGFIIFSDLMIGDSVAVNGVCLTVTGIQDKCFTADVMPETMNRSSLSSLNTGDTVNLERAMPADGRFGGHIVTGHIDGTGTITSLVRDDNAMRYTISAPPKILALLVEKGSIAIDGISLTVTTVTAQDFNVSIIPHTMNSTTLSRLKTGASVNLENDVIGKYVQRMVYGNFDYGGASKSASHNRCITLEQLELNGYV